MINNYDELVTRLEKIKTFTENTEDLEIKQDDVKKLMMEVENYKNGTEEIINEFISFKLAKEPNIEINAVKEKINIINQYKDLIWSETNYYQGLRFSELIDDLQNPETLLNFCNTLKEIIAIFKKMEIELSVDNFNYSIDVKKFIALFLCEQNNIHTTEGLAKIKTIFDELYWQNKNILFDIAINIRELINKNEKIIKKYVNITKDNYYKENKILLNNYEEELVKLIERLHILKDTDKYMLFDLFKSGKFNINDFIISDDKVFNQYFMFINEEEYMKKDLTSRAEYYKSIESLWHNLCEYERFEKFRFLIDHIKEIIGKKNEIISNYKQKEKNISKITKARNKLNAKLIKLILKNTLKPKEKLLAKINKNILLVNTTLDELRKEYLDYERVRFENLVVTTFNENNTLAELFQLFARNKVELKQEIKNHFSDVSKEDLIELIASYNKFVNNINNKLLINVNNKEIDTIKDLIIEKYKLLNINFSLEDISSPAFEELKNAIKKIMVHESLKTIDLTPQEIKTILEIIK